MTNPRLDICATLDVNKYSKRPVQPNCNFLVEITEKQPKPPKKKADAGGEDAPQGVGSPVDADTPDINQIKKKFKLVENDRPKPAFCKAIEWDQSGFLKKYVARYRELGGPRAEKLKHVDTFCRRIQGIQC